MPKRKAQVSKPLLIDFLSNYDRKSLLASLNTLEVHEGWTLFVSYLQFVQRDYEVKALDLIAKQDSTQTAAYASGYAKAVEEMGTGFIGGLRKVVSGTSDALYQAVEEPEVVDHPTEE